MTNAFSWKNSISLYPASFWTPKPNFPVTPGYLLTSYFCIPVPYDEKDIFFFLVSILEGLVGLVQSLLLSISGTLSHFHHPEKKHGTHQQSRSSTANQLFVSMDSSILDISYKLNHIICSHLGLSSPNLHNVSMLWHILVFHSFLWPNNLY